MSYIYQDALILPKRIGAQWESKDLRGRIVADIYSEYRQVILKLAIVTPSQVPNVPDQKQVFYIDMDEVRKDYASYNNTLEVWLMSIGYYGFTKLKQLPVENRYILYNDALRAGYSYRLCKAGIELPPEAPKDDFYDLALYRQYKGTEIKRQDMRVVHDYALVSVNGLFHNTGATEDICYIFEGGRSIRTKNVGHVGITSFFNVGKLSRYTKIGDLLYSTQPGWKLKNMIGFDLEVNKEDKGKPFFLVLGGYLVMPEEGVFWKVNDKSYRLNLNRLPYIERLLECQNFMSLVEMKLTESRINRSNLSLDEIYSDEAIKGYFNLSQSFMVFVDTNKLFWYNVPIRQALMPGIFTSYEDPRYPLVLGHGRIGEYWKIEEDGHWSITVVDSWYRNYIFGRNQKYDYKNVTSQLACDRPFYYSQGSLLEIGTSKMKDVEKV